MAPTRRNEEVISFSVWAPYGLQKKAHPREGCLLFSTVLSHFSLKRFLHAFFRVYKRMNLVHSPPSLPTLHIIGGGLAGCEAAWQAARFGVPVRLYEMRPHQKTGAHTTDALAELVCSNSFRSDDALYNAVGVLHREMRQCTSLILKAADEAKVPAGGALAVDREQFSKTITQTLEAHPLISIQREEITTLPETEPTIVATGPLTSPALTQALQTITGEDSLAFFDAIAPIVYKESIDFSKAWFQSRYDKGTGTDYINCPLSSDDYTIFINELLQAETTEFKEWEKNTPYFEGCLPIEVMAARGHQTLLYGPMKPVGLTNPHAPHQKPRAIVQLRQDNTLGTLYNIVGFQTKMRHAEQKRVLRLIPGLENAEFARLGGIHRNTFLNSPRLLDETLALKTRRHIRFAGQMTGCEGYVESAATGLLAGLFSASEILETTLKRTMQTPPQTTALGALLHHITGGAHSETYQPMNINFGLFPPPDDMRDERGRIIRGRERKALYSKRADVDLSTWLHAHPLLTAQRSIDRSVGCGDVSPESRVRSGNQEALL